MQTSTGEGSRPNKERKRGLLSKKRPQQKRKQEKRSISRQDAFSAISPLQVVASSLRGDGHDDDDLQANEAKPDQVEDPVFVIVNAMAEFDKDGHCAGLGRVGQTATLVVVVHHTRCECECDCTVAIGAAAVAATCQHSIREEGGVGER